MANHIVKGEDIKRLVTRFQYRKDEMCFEILLRMNNAVEMVSFLKTTDYGIFRKTFDEIMTARSEKRNLQVSPSSNFQSFQTNAA